MSVRMLSIMNDEERALSNRLLNWVALSCVVCGIVWGVFIQKHLGTCITALIPVSFSVIVAPFLIWNQIKPIQQLLAKVQSLAIIFVPWAIQLSLGSATSGMVILWGILGPLCGIFFLSKREALHLIIIYLVNALIAIFGNVQLTNDALFATERFTTTFYAMNITLPSMVFFAALWFAFNQMNVQRNRVSELLTSTENRNKDLVESITYAQHVQNAILPSFKQFQELLPESVLLMRPKDIVSGDFFWEKQVGTRLYFAVCDSTGHGVPGALVSVICNRSLNTAIDAYQLTDPGEILDRTRQLVTESFSHSDDQETQVTDGMDIGLCCLDGDMLLFSGAKHSLYLLRGTGKLEEIKGSRQSIGYSIGNRRFTTHVRHIQTDDRVFMTTDGLLDQFGGTHQRKFKAAQFRQLLLDTRHLPIKEQGMTIERAVLAWMGHLPQTDDICLLGVQLHVDQHAFTTAGSPIDQEPQATE